MPDGAMPDHLLEGRDRLDEVDDAASVQVEPTQRSIQELRSSATWRSMSRFSREPAG